jgi:pimeloyl-ACP methyl ester carboxylesterase
LTEKIVKANGVDICTETFGDPADPTILLVMGATASMLRWPDEFCERLAQGGRHVIRYDNRDTGRSVTYEPGNVPYTVEDMADDAVGVLDAYGIDRAHIVGASMGGMITQQVALRHPDRVITITPIMSTPDASGVAAVASGEETTGTTSLPTPSPEFMAQAMSSLALDWNDEDAVVENGVTLWKALAGSRYPFDEEQARDITIKEMKRASSYRSSQNHILAIANTPRWRQRLAEIKVPTLVIHGTEDPILPYPHGVAIAEGIPGATMLALEGCGHELPEPEADNVVGAILKHTS